MVVVFSINEDNSTEDVVDWFDHYGENFYRINNIDDINSFIEKHQMLLIPETENAVTSVWYRKSPSKSLTTNVFNNPNTDRSVRLFAYSEQNGLFESLFSLLGEKEWLNHWSNSSPAKFHQLLLASKCGLNVPATYVTNSKEQLLDFMSHHASMIVKPIQDVESIELDGKRYFQYTKVLHREDINRLNNTFFPGLFQKEIKKNLEIRSFYLDGKLYSMAICSSFDRQTQMDFRRYNDKYPNRTIPYQLPKEIEKKLNIFMEEMNLNCGSIDLILDDSGDYYFLEVNPVGQFGMVSYPCNYYLERKIANFLIQSNNE